MLMEFVIIAPMKDKLFSSNSERLTFDIFFWYEIDPTRRDLAEAILNQTERELKRPLIVKEAKLVLAKDGHFPEIDKEIRQRELCASIETRNIGIELNRPKKVESADLFSKNLVLGRNRLREGD